MDLRSLSDSSVSAIFSLNVSKLQVLILSEHTNKFFYTKNTKIYRKCA